MAGKGKPGRKSKAQVAAELAAQAQTAPTALDIGPVIEALANSTAIGAAIGRAVTAESKTLVLQAEIDALKLTVQRLEEANADLLDQHKANLEELMALRAARSQPAPAAPGLVPPFVVTSHNSGPV